MTDVKKRKSRPADRRQIKKNTRWRVQVQEALKKRGILHAFALWQKIGGSKETATHLWNGDMTMVRLETFDRLEDAFGISPYEILVKIETVEKPPVEPE